MSSASAAVCRRVARLARQSQPSRPLPSTASSPPPAPEAARRPLQRRHAAGRGGHVDADVHVLVVGAGFSGLLCAVSLLDAGYAPAGDAAPAGAAAAGAGPSGRGVRVVDSATGVGGAWHWNRYPGAACDVQSYHYLPLLRRAGYVPPRKFVEGGDIRGYARRLAAATGVDACLQLQTRVEALRWDGEARLWRVRTRRCVRQADAAGDAPDASTWLEAKEEALTARFVVLATGPLDAPRPPDVEGLSRFAGRVMHTARWDSRVPLRGRRVGVIGTGASAAQLIERLARDDAGLKELVVFQRSPTHCVPRDDEPTPADLERQLRAEGNDKLRQDVQREVDATMVAWLHKPRANKKICDDVNSMVPAVVRDPETARLLTPTTPFWSKRVLVLDDYLPAFNSERVKLVADPGGVVSVDEAGATTADGRHFPLDVIVTATGFDVWRCSIADCTGVDGDDQLSNHVGERSRTAWGMMVDGFPNLFLMVGPQTLNPVTNVTLVSEKQAHVIASLLQHMQADGTRTVEATAEAVRDWAECCARHNEGKVWATVSSWYNGRGRVDSKSSFWGSYTQWLDELDARLRDVAGAAARNLLVFGK